MICIDCHRHGVLIYLDFIMQLLGGIVFYLDSDFGEQYPHTDPLIFLCEEGSRLSLEGDSSP
jgi:hypothetical protein